MNVLEQRYMTIVSGKLPVILDKLEKLNNNFERLINLLENENCKS